MPQLNKWRRALLARGIAAVLVAASLAACGGGDDDVYVAPLDLALTRVGPLAIQLDWSDDPYVASFDVVRDGYLLATVDALSLIDTSVYYNQTFCYQVTGYDAYGVLVAASATGCITVLP